MYAPPLPPSSPFHSILRLLAVPHRCVVIIVLLCSYKRDPVRTRNGAGTFTQSREPSVEIYLSSSGGSSFWVIQVDDRVVYRMMPNPLDENYAICPNVEGCWDIADPKPGN